MEDGSAVAVYDVLLQPLPLSPQQEQRVLSGELG